MSPVVSRGPAQIHLEDPEHMRTLAEQAAEELADAPAGNRDAAKLIGPLKPSIAVIPMM